MEEKTGPFYSCRETVFRTSSDSVMTRLCSGPQSWFLSWEMSQPLKEDSGTTLASWAGQAKRKRGYSHKQEQRKFTFGQFDTGNQTNPFRLIQLLAVLLKRSGLGVVMASKSTSCLTAREREREIKNMGTVSISTQNAENYI